MLTEMLGNVAQAASQSPDANENRLLDVRPEKRILMVVIAADRGLAGGFNANLLKMAQRFADDHGHAELSFLVIGKKSRDYFRRRGKNIFGEHVDLYRNLKLEDADRIANSIIESFTRAEVDSVYLFVNEFKNVMASTLHTSRLLPIEVPKNAEPPDYIYEQKPEEFTDRARASIRFSLGRSNTVEQIDALIEAVVDSVAHLRKISPLTPAHA
jgi:F-type H+-transporting ATPase subunit gamma